MSALVVQSEEVEQKPLKDETTRFWERGLGEKETSHPGAAHPSVKRKGRDSVT